MEIILPDTVTDIGSSAFNYCTRLKKAVLSSSLNRIGNGAFSYCSSLESVEIKSVEVIAEKAFLNCDSLKSISVPDNNKTVDEKAFGYVNNSKSETFAFSVHADSAAEKYAKENGFIFEIRDHKYLQETTIEPTCSGNGLSTFSCACGKEYKQTIPATKHDYETTTVSATCNTQGYEMKTCKVCGQSTFVITEATRDHDFDKQVAIVANCVSDGLYICTCKKCGYSKVEIMPANGHKFVVDAAGKEPTCTEPGVSKGIHCTECGYAEKSEILPATGHTEEIIKGKSATCAESGLTDGKKCSVCGVVLEEQKEIPALGHTDTDNDGKCDRCGEKTGEPVNPPQPDPSANCNHICHKSGISAFFYRIARFFRKLFKTHKYCSCGAAHY